MKSSLITGLLFGIFVLTLNAMPVQADDREDALIDLSTTWQYVPSPWTAAYGYKDQSLGKFGYGLTNTLLGWMDLFLEPAEAVSKDQNVFAGLAHGVKDGLQNTLGGLVHLVTFPITRIDLTLPEGGVNWQA